MQEWYSRTEMLFGHEAIEALAAARVAVFGVGGVGGYAVEVMARSGVGHLDLIDNDTVSITNINRQIIALNSNVGQYKVDVARQRVLDINPQCDVRAIRMFYLPEEADNIDLSEYEYVVDCIDTIKAKIDIAMRCHELGIPVISSMGAANKLDPTMFRVTDLSKTSMDPIARIMRKKLRKAGIEHLKVVYSEEQPEKINCNDTPDDSTATSKRPVPASNAFVPAAAGIIIGGEVVKDIIGIGRKQ